MYTPPLSSHLGELKQRGDKKMTKKMIDADVLLESVKENLLEYVDDFMVSHHDYISYDELVDIINKITSIPTGDKE
jgi:hypothetical protein